MSQQREELFKGIKAIANKVRGSVDGWDFKHYVLGTLFYRYLSEYLEHEVTSDELKYDPEFVGFSNMKNDEVEETFKNCIKTDLRFYINPEDLFCNVVKNAKDNKNLNTDLDRIFGEIISSSEYNGEIVFEGLFDEFDLNSAKLGNSQPAKIKTLYNLLKGVSEMDLGSFKDNNVDAFGDVYENLMSMYASEAGKSGGEFFTPQEVSELVARIALNGREHVDKVYDPTCGSGSLLLKFSKFDPKKRTKYYGQELNITTYNLSRMNMFLHGIESPMFDIKHGDTLLDPKHEGKEQFDAIVSNPPYSVHWKGDADPTLINDPRFAPAGVLAPNTKADLAFIMHILHNLKNSGTAAVVVFPGILYRNNDKKEPAIRKYLVENNFVDAVIELPQNIFYGTGITTDILVLKKNKTTTDVKFIDGSKEFVSLAKTNKLSQDNIDNILAYFEDGKEIDHVVKIATREEIAAKDYDLSVNKYVEKEDTREVIDIESLDKELDSIVSSNDTLRSNIKKLTKVEKEEQE